MNDVRIHGWGVDRSKDPREIPGVEPNVLKWYAVKHALEPVAEDANKQDPSGDEWAA